MQLRHLTVLSVAIASVVATTFAFAPAAGPVEFVAHDIDPKLPGAYAVNIADFNKDGTPDVIANSLGVRELAWYRTRAGRATSSSRTRQAS